MASLQKSSGGWYYLIWSDNDKSPRQLTEPLKTTNKREALALKARLETEYYAGDHNPWSQKWFKRNKSTNTDILIVALDHYLKSRIESKTWTDSTRVSNTTRLKKYTRQLGETRDPSSITAKEVFKLVNSQKIKESSMHSDLIKLRAFFNWMYNEKIIPEQLKIPHIRIQRALPQYLTPEQISEVCDYLIKKKNSLSKFQRTEQDNTLWHIDAIWLSARTGMRIDELMKLRVQDCASDQILVGGSFTTKGKKQRIVPLMREAVEVVRKYTDSEYRAADPYLSRNNYLFGRSGVAPKVKLSKTFVKAVKECLGIKRRYHDLRHSFAYWYLTAESDKNTQFRLVALKEILGHESIETTMIYAKISTSDLRL
jgi:site-specific recombinase XerD